MHLGMMKTFALRYTILAPMAFCICLLIASSDVNVRLAAMAALILLELARDWSLLATARSLAKGNKPS